MKIQRQRIKLVAAAAALALGGGFALNAVAAEQGKLLIWMGDNGLLPGQFSALAGLAIDKNNRVLTSEQYPGRVQIFRYVTDAEAKLEWTEREKLAAEKKTAPAAKKESAQAKPETTVPK